MGQYWKSGIIRKVCTTLNAAETRGVLKLDDSVNMAQQLSIIIKGDVNLKDFTYSRPLLESIGSSSQVTEKALRQSVAFLKQSLEENELESYGWIEVRKLLQMFCPSKNQRGTC